MINAGGINGGNPNNANLGNAVNQGFVTTGPNQQELFIYKQNNTFTINSVIKDNATGPVSVVFREHELRRRRRIDIAGNQHYTGTTYVNGVNTNLNGTLGNPTLKGDLVISNATNNATDANPLITVTLNNSEQPVGQPRPT